MRFTLRVAAAALILCAGAAALPSTTSAQQTPAAAASLVADAMQRQLPLEANGMMMRRVHAEGDLLIVTTELPADATEGNHSEYVLGFIAGVCQTPPSALFENRVRLRIDTYSRGGPTRQSEVFTRCPPKSAA